MPHPPATVKRVDHHLDDALLELWTAYRIESGTSPEAARRMVSDGVVSTALARPDVAAYVAISERRPLGYVVLTDRALSPFTDSGCVAIDQLYVAVGARRLGVAKLLVAAVAAHAERVGSDQVASNVPAGGREANRFFARLGFTPHTVRRITTTAALHRRLADENGSRYSLEQVLARRRSARLRAAHRQGVQA